MEPQISVVMSVHNGEVYLKEAIESILNQTYINFEFIIINDASSDNSEQIIKEFTDKRILLINNEENLGLTKSLNKGINIAKGKYIARMDADDISEVSRLEKQFNFLETNDSCSVVGSNIQLIDKEGNSLEIVKYPESSEENLGNIFFANCVVHSAAMFKKSEFETIGGYNEEYKKAQDYDLWFKFIKNGGSLYNIQEPLVKYRIHNESISIKHSQEQDKTAKTILIDNFNSILGIKMNFREADYIRHVKNLNPIQNYFVYNFLIKSNRAFINKFKEHPFAHKVFAHNSLNLLKEERYRELFKKNIIEKNENPN